MSDLLVGYYYNFKNQPEILVYRGKNGFWHQFSLKGSLDIWCEIPDSDLWMIERTPE